jgi:hypothetical protein
MQPASSDLADLLTRWNDGDAAAFDELVPIVYEALRQVARVRRRREPRDVSLDTTSLVHEAYLKPLSLATVKRDLQYARAWLAERVAEGALTP